MQFRKNIEKLSVQLVIFIIINLDRVFCSLSNVSEASPDLIILSIYYFTIFKPEYLSVILLNLLSIYSDVTSGMFIGASNMTNFIFYRMILVYKNILIGKSFKPIWGIFCLFYLIVTSMKYTVACIIYKKLFSLSFVVMQYIFTICSYPLIHDFYRRVTKK